MSETYNPKLARAKQNGIEKLTDFMKRGGSVALDGQTWVGQRKIGKGANFIYQIPSRFDQLLVSMTLPYSSKPQFEISGFDHTKYLWGEISALTNVLEKTYKEYGISSFGATARQDVLDLFSKLARPVVKPTSYIKAPTR